MRLAIATTGQVTKIGPSSLAPGQSQVVTFPAERGEIGPQRDWKITVEEEGEYVLHLFRYDPLERSLSLAEAMLDRLAAKGLDVRESAAERRNSANASARLRPRSRTLPSNVEVTSRPERSNETCSSAIPSWRRWKRFFS